MKRYIAALLILVILTLTACKAMQTLPDGTTEPTTVSGSTEATETGTTEATRSEPVNTTDATASATTVPTTESTAPATTEPATEATTAPTEPVTTEPATEATTAPTEPAATEPTAKPTEPTVTEPTEPATEPTTAPTEPPTTPPTEPTPNTPAETVSIQLDRSAVTLEIGDTVVLNATTTGSGTLIWGSSSTAVADVDTNGKVTAKAIGTATIIVTYGGKTATCVVVVAENASEIGTFTFNTPDWSEIYVGETLQLSYSYTGDKAALTFKSGRRSTLTVTNSGSVTGVSAGTTTVEAYHGSALLGIIDIVVKDKPVEETKPEAERISVSACTGPYFDGTFGVVGNYMTFVAFAKTSGDNQVVTATSSNSGVATVSLSSVGSSNFCTFKVSFVGSGSATITITSEDGHASTSYTLNVKGGYSSAMSGQLTPEQFVACANGIMAENGANIATDKGYRVLTLTESELTGSRALKLAEGWVREFYPKGIKYIGLSYQGMDENGNYIFYIHC